VLFSRAGRLPSRAGRLPRRAGRLPRRAGRLLRGGGRLLRSGRGSGLGCRRSLTISAVIWDDSVVLVVGGLNTETTAGECLPQQALVSTVVPVLVGRDPGVASTGEGGVARLDGEGVNEDWTARRTVLKNLLEATIMDKSLSVIKDWQRIKPS
jgi:hypothetical protein